MGSGEIHPDLDRTVERDGFADLTARVRVVILFVDRRTLDLKEEALARRSIEQLDGFRRHLGAAWLPAWTVIFPADLRACDVGRIRQGFEAAPLRRHIAG